MASAYDQGQASLYFQTVPASGNDLVSFYIDDFQLTYVAAAVDPDRHPFDLPDAVAILPDRRGSGYNRSLRPA